MRGAAAAAGMVSAAILFVPGCGRDTENKAGTADPVRRASFRSLAARDHLLGCPSGRARAETRRQLERLSELNRFAFNKGAVRSLQLAENDWRGLAAHDDRPRCAPGEAAYLGALGEFSARLDELAAGIAEYRP